MALNKPLLTIGITMGDPCGIGPEVALRAIAQARVRRLARFVLLGGASVFRTVARRWRMDISAVPTLRTVPRDGFRRTCSIINVCPTRSSLAFRGEATAQGGRASARCILRAVELAQSGVLDAIVTAPINKLAIRKAGYHWPGHTEMLADQTGTQKPVMMMVGGGLRVALVTTHAAIRELPRMITRRNVLQTIEIANRSLKRCFNLPVPRLAVCGLNPHAGEAGRFGNEEATRISPAIADACGRGIKCSGPYPADVVFGQALKGRFDAVVAMYHDQANIPVKLLAFESGVNVTLGLPIIRTSPDHGTAYDIVRDGTADPGSMIAAIKLAAKMALARRRRPGDSA